MDVTAVVVGAINAWLATLATELLDPAVAAVADLLFRTPAFGAMSAVARTWRVVCAVADGLLALAWLGAALLVMTRGGSDARYTSKILIPRVLLAAILANASLALCAALITLNNALVGAILAPSPAAAVAAAFAALLRPQQLGADLVAVVLGVAAATLALVLVAVSIGRAFVLLLAIALAPLALITYALPDTEDLARLWLRVFSGLLFVEVLQAVLVRIAVEVVRTGDWLGGASSVVVNGLVIGTLLYALLRLPFAAYAWAFRASFSRSPVARTITRGARALRGVA